MTRGHAIGRPGEANIANRFGKPTRRSQYAMKLKEIAEDTKGVN